MNTFNQYNNANIIVNNEFIFDPWLYGSLYNNSWYPYGKKTLKEGRLKKIKYCFCKKINCCIIANRLTKMPVPALAFHGELID